MFSSVSLLSRETLKHDKIYCSKVYKKWIAFSNSEDKWCGKLYNVAKCDSLVLDSRPKHAFMETN